MTSRHQTTRVQKMYQRLLKRCPVYLQLDYSLIGNLADLRFQIENEIDLIEDGGGSIKTKAQLRRVKMLLADVVIAQQEETRA